MKKTRFLIFILFPLIFCLMTIVVKAHSGKTDGNGGHTDHSTGEYHYHHGYSAHDHYDMDGDGDLDCPYDFDDKTGINSGSSSYNNYSYSGSSYSYTDSQEETKIIEKIVEKEVPYTPGWVPWVVTLLSLTVIVLIFYCIGKRNELRDLEKNSEEEKRKYNDKEQITKNKLKMLDKDLTFCFGFDYLSDLCGVPDNTYLDGDLMPHTNTDNREPDKYIFYLGGYYTNRTNVKYHYRRCRYANPSRPINAYQIQKNIGCEPCMVCNPHIPSVDWVDKYRTYHNLMKEDENK